MSSREMVVVTLQLPGAEGTTVLKLEPEQTLQDALKGVLNGEDLRYLEEGKLVLHDRNGQALRPETFKGQDLVPSETYRVQLEPTRLVGL